MQSVKAILRIVKYTYRIVYIRCIYVFNLCSKIKLNKWGKEKTFTTIHTVIQRGLTGILTYVTEWRVSTETLSVTAVQLPHHNVSLGWKHLSAVNSLLQVPVRCQAVKTLAVHCHSDVCSALGVHSAECRTSWVCLQHHATVVTSNGVTVCGSKFPPALSKHCQHQHSSIPKTPQTIWDTNNPSCCDIQGAASSVQQHGSLCP
jgi:hypothetical protein